MKKPKQKSCLIVFEGPEGAGKTTQSKLLAESLGKSGYKVYLTREPGGTPVSEDIREIFLKNWQPFPEVLKDASNPASKSSAGNYNFDIETQILLITAARRDHVNNVIKPKLQEGYIVVCDRFVYSTLVYQGLDPFLRNKIIKLHRLFVGVAPDLLINICPPFEIIEKRLLNRVNNNVVDTQDTKFHKGLIAQYNKMFENYNKNLKNVNYTFLHRLFNRLYTVEDKTYNPSNIFPKPSSILSIQDDLGSDEAYHSHINDWVSKKYNKK